MIDQINPPAVVQSEHQTAQYWHEVAVKAHNARSNSSLDHAEALYHLKVDEGFKDLGFKSLAEYVFENFGKSKQWSEKLVAIHAKFVEELKQTKETLKEVTFGKVSKLLSVVDEGNVEDLLDFAKTATQKEVDLKVKELQGLEPNETQVDDDTLTMRFKMPNEVADVIQASLELARDEYKESHSDAEVLDFQALEIMAANYALSRDISGELDSTLAYYFSRLEEMYNITINWEKKNV